MRFALAAWGWLMVSMVVTSAAFPSMLSESPAAVRGWPTIVVMVFVSCEGLLLVLPFPWLARHDAVRRTLATGALLTFALPTWRVLRHGLEAGDAVALPLLYGPPIVALILIHRERRRQRIDYAATFD